jgi:ligand-binding SRPBCC domain-containing protein
MVSAGDPSLKTTGNTSLLIKVRPVTSIGRWRESAGCAAWRSKDFQVFDDRPDLIPRAFALEWRHVHDFRAQRDDTRREDFPTFP